MQELQLAARQVWFQFRGEFETDGGEARSGSRGRRANEEKLVGSVFQVCLVAGGRTVSWTEVTRLAEDTIVEIVCNRLHESPVKTNQEIE